MELDRGQRARLGEISRQRGLRLVVLFGSAATGRMHAHSDVDIGVLFETEPSFSELAELTHDLSAVVGTPHVDVAVLNHADPLFLWQMMRSARLLFGEGRDFARMRLSAFRRYHDFRPRLAHERKYVADYLAERA